jgi:hypothetical protein
MHLLVVSYTNGDREYFGPFPTFFRANEYGLALTNELGNLKGLKKIACVTPVPLVLPHTMRVRFK